VVAPSSWSKLIPSVVESGLAEDKSSLLLLQDIALKLSESRSVVESKCDAGVLGLGVSMSKEVRLPRNSLDFVAPPNSSSRSWIIHLA